jgi:hypothetical protein
MNEITLQQLAQQMSGMPDVHNPEWATACSRANLPLRRATCRENYNVKR